MSLPNKKLRQGFTLIELLVVISILVVLSVAVYVALDPAGRLLDARNSRRTTDANNILTAVHECIVDNDGVLSDCGLSTSLAETQLGTCTGTGATLCTGAAADCLDLSTDLASYLVSIPEDPLSGSSASTGYSVTVNANNIVTITACVAEGGTAIQVSR